MPVPLIRCRNDVTGATAEIPKTALRHLTNWVPIDDAATSPGGASAPSTGAPDPAAPTAEGGPATAAKDSSASAPVGKSKAAKATTTSSKEG